MKRLFSIVIFGVLFAFSINIANDVFVEKYMNRPYMLSKELENIDDVDVQIYGSCHAYTSFNSKLFTEEYGIYSYNMSGPGEIMPTTYLKMYERFKTDKPEIAVVEIWGIQAYETYEPTYKILDDYLRINVENVPFSFEKLEVIEDFYALDALEDNFALLKYKDRLTNFSINELDFNYSFEASYDKYCAEEEVYAYEEMKNRFANNGFKDTSYWPLYDYEKQQAVIGENEKLEVEADLLKYVDKIIELCKENDVKLMFYRSPYRSTPNELRKANWLADYLEEKDVLFVDIEPEIEWDYVCDFYDYEHLSRYGAEKATRYLGDIIMKELGSSK